MHSILTSLLFALVAPSIYANPDHLVPEGFHGLWDEPERCAAVLSVGIPDMGAQISGNQMTQYEQYCSQDNPHPKKWW